MKATFENSVNVLLQAYLNDKLEHCNCNACAVGDLLGGSDWSRLFMTATNEYTGLQVQFLAKRNEVIGKNLFQETVVVPVSGVQDEVKRQVIAAKGLIKRSGYSIPQLAKIEYAFETAPKGKSDDDWMFNGLMAVIDVLAEIHNVDLTVKEEIKNPFIKQYELLTA